MKVRRVATVDELDRDGERLVLLDDRVIRLAGIAPTVLDAVVGDVEIVELSKAVLRSTGDVPDGVDGEAVIRSAVDDLVREGLLELLD